MSDNLVALPIEYCFLVQVSLYFYMRYLEYCLHTPTTKYLFLISVIEFVFDLSSFICIHFELDSMLASVIFIFSLLATRYRYFRIPDIAALDNLNAIDITHLICKHHSLGNFNSLQKHKHQLFLLASHHPDLSLVSHLLFF